MSSPMLVSIASSKNRKKKKKKYFDSPSQKVTKKKEDKKRMTIVKRSALHANAIIKEVGDDLSVCLMNLLL